MRRSSPPALMVALAGMLGGCTGTGVFLDHTFIWFDQNPNGPAGSSETFLRVRGQSADVPPLAPEQGNVWPGPAKPDPTMDDLQKQQADEIRRGTGQPNPGQSNTGQGSPPTNGAEGNPQGSAVGRANAADRGLPPPRVPPVPPNRTGPTVITPNGPSVDVTGGNNGSRGYRQLQSPTPGGSGILVPNGNGTSTLIGPDGSVQTVPTR